MVRAAVLLSLVSVGLASAQPDFPEPKMVPPDETTLKLIATKTRELCGLTDQLRMQKTPLSQAADALVYLKAAEWIVRHQEWFAKDSGQQTVRVLEAGITRARHLLNGERPWLKVTGKPIIIGIVSEVDQSIQPVSMTLPLGFYDDVTKRRVDIVLHGRDQSLTEVKFIHQREIHKGGFKGDYILLEPYGRGNNAYRWAGETDVLESMTALAADQAINKRVDVNQMILRGFSMGGAGAWHIGLHNQHRYAVVSPGAGFTTTRGYIKNFPDKLPDYQEKCLRIYDAVVYAENAFNFPVVAYSGELDPQKAAADTIVSALKNFKERLNFTHIVAPKLGHSLPAEWQAKLDLEYRKYLPRSRVRERERFVTYTTMYHDFHHGNITGLDQHYEKSIVDSTLNDKTLTITTTNISSFNVYPLVDQIIVDGQSIDARGVNRQLALRKVQGKWQIDNPAESIRLRKGVIVEGEAPLQGPIDDAFRGSFVVVPPQQNAGWHPATSDYIQASHKRFAAEWNKFFRGELPTSRLTPPRARVLFGDPQSNPAIAAILPKLPITWTATELVVNRVKYDPKSHVPVLIYPVVMENQSPSAQYVVLNSGHTFHAADFRGTNALLYPRLGDWAVLKPTPTDKDPLAAEVVAAGLFDENWQFEKR